MLQLVRTAVPITVLGCMVLVYSVLLGFGVQAAVAPVVAIIGAEPAVEAATSLGAPEVGAEPVVQAPVRSDRSDRLNGEQQLIAYLQYRKTIEARLAGEFGIGDSRYRLAQLVVDESLARSIDPWLTYSVIKLESGFAAGAVGRAGEIGLMQVLPSTGRMVAERSLGIKAYDASMLFDPAFNIKVGTTHLAYLLEVYEGDVSDALTAYNAGHANVTRRAYAERVLQFYGEYRKLEAPAAARIAALLPPR